MKKNFKLCSPPDFGWAGGKGGTPPSPGFNPVNIVLRAVFSAREEPSSLARKDALYLRVLQMRSAYRKGDVPVLLWVWRVGILS